MFNLNDLRKPFPIDAIEWRVGATNKNKNGGKATKGIALAYITARDVMERLDAVVGPENWQNKHPHANGKTSCAIGIRISNEWVWKENGAGDSAMDAEKGAFSDSFKRAAVLWGIGQYLYNVPNIWVDLDEWGQIKDKKDPRLLKALQQAAQGIRMIAEDEPESVDESKILIDGINAAKNLDDLETEKSKARASWSRLNADQRTGVTNAIAAMEAKHWQAPPAKMNGNGAHQ